MVGRKRAWCHYPSARASRVASYIGTAGCHCGVVSPQEEGGSLFVSFVHERGLGWPCSQRVKSVHPLRSIYRGKEPGQTGPEHTPGPPGWDLSRRATSRAGRDLAVTYYPPSGLGGQAMCADPTAPYSSVLCLLCLNDQQPMRESLFFVFIIFSPSNFVSPLYLYLYLCHSPTCSLTCFFPFHPSFLHSSSSHVSTSAATPNRVKRTQIPSGNGP